MSTYTDLGYNDLLKIPNTVDLADGITNANADQILGSGSVGFSQTSLNTLQTNQNMESKNYIPGISGWKIYGSGAAEFQLIASKGYIKVYSQDTVPTGGTYYQGDLWYDTNDSNKRYVYNLGAWVVDEGISKWSQIIDDGGKPDDNADVTGNHQGDIYGSNINNDAGWTDDSALNTFVSDIYTGDIAGLQSQIDGQVTTWFYAYEPTLINSPALDWTTSALKIAHLGDLFYNTTTGYSYRFQVITGTYSWQKLSDSDIAAALAAASNAQDTADGKRRVFTSTPVTPYDVGDLWLTSLTSANGDLKKCITAATSGAYNSAHWVLATAYTEGATWGTNLINVPTLLTAPTGTGLFTDNTHLGYYTDSAWKTYIDNTGNLVLGDIAGGGIGLAWNQAAGTLNIKGSITMSGGSISWASVTAPSYTNITGTKPPTNATNGATWGLNIDGSNKPADNATVGATWGVNVYSKPSDSDIYNSYLANGSYSGGTFISGTTIYSPVIVAGSFTAKSGSTIVAVMNSNGVKVNGQQFALYSADGVDLYGYIGGNSGYYNMETYGNRNMRLSAGSATIHVNSTVSPLSAGGANLGYYNYPFGNIYGLNFAFNNSQYFNVSGSNIVSNSDFRVAGSLSLSGNITMENYMNLKAKDSGGTSHDLTCQWNATLQKYIMSS